MFFSFRGCGDKRADDRGFACRNRRGPGKYSRYVISFLTSFKMETAYFCIRGYCNRFLNTDQPPVSLLIVSWQLKEWNASTFFLVAPTGTFGYWTVFRHGNDKHKRKLDSLPNLLHNSLPPRSSTQYTLNALTLHSRLALKSQVLYTRSCYNSRTYMIPAFCPG